MVKKSFLLKVREGKESSLIVTVDTFTGFLSLSGANVFNFKNKF